MDVRRKGNVVLHQNIRDNAFAFFLKKIQPFRHGSTITCECMLGGTVMVVGALAEVKPFRCKGTSGPLRQTHHLARIAWRQR